MSQVDLDRQLIRRLRDGDERAFTAFFDQYFPRLYRFALVRLGGDQHAAAEVVQEVLSRAVRKLDSWRGEAALFTWLCTICRREVSTYCRRNNKRVQHEVLSEDRPELMAVIESLAAREDDNPEKTYQRAELARLIQVTLDQLPVRYGDALEWKYLYGLSAKEIARRLGISVDATNSLLARAKRAFREAYGLLADHAPIRQGSES